MAAISVVIPAYNEGESIYGVLERIRRELTQANIECEILVVVDGATDNTAEEARRAADRVVEHPANMGYGRSLKTGILAASHELIAISDADGTYPIDRLPDLIRESDRFHMVVGARTGRIYRGSLFKGFGRTIFRWLSEFAAGQQIPDINSGMRVFRRSHILPFFPIISAGFSFTTTSTLAFLLNDLFVHYIPIEYHQRSGNSKVRHFRDSIRALQIIVEAILRCNPIKIFLLLSFPFGFLTLCILLVALLRGSTSVALWATVPLSATGLILAIGFLAVSIMPRRRVADAEEFLLDPPQETASDE